ncbi:ABC transporter ATP-binding protein [Desulfoscipio gibsoniae]|uniref:ABC-type polysaccharide/polyol phosphate transport system, ATPase component n=1 Tax=Desulfoscipio gibsoniae DSM 7213 TaxID=767817 RepID=R4KT63_9FIRM|nr:ABC transporter ATP-binding protein [Desulfoscipio gibsoniae]AGL03785.1 ABC-type polysaccharide/polyol phosphate transport system, ATPase component [Desulfoscipio gibsoniae DSM 7213]
MSLHIEVENLCKKFQLRQQRAYSLSKIIHQFIERRAFSEMKDFWALNGVSFQMEAGDSLGVIGVNGSGKSTLLKLLTGTMRPTSGRITVNGRRSALIELGAGFHPDFSGRENVYLNGMILGLDKNQIRKKFDEIVEFAEIEQFIDTPVKYYSSGMYARLGFAVATAVEPEILIVDEILAVGDMAFQQKCARRIEEMLGRGISLVLVSHGTDDIRRICRRTLWLHKGEPMKLGPSGEVLDSYMNFMGVEE